jgi:signal transduction histidine kinase
MSRLFWRMFAGLWLGSAVMMIGATLSITLLTQRDVPDPVRTTIGPMLRATARSTLALYQRLDTTHFAEHVETLRRDDRLTLYMLDARGREVLGRTLPAQVVEISRTFGPGQNMAMLPDSKGPQSFFFNEIPTASDGRRYRLVIIVPTPGFPGVAFLIRQAGPAVLVSILIAGFFSALSARYLVAPIDHLRRATRQFAAGDLASRVGATLRARRDEFGGLAADFDRMADRIGALIGTQRQLMLDLSHELRSPLARLRVALELMRDQPRSALLDRMERDADRMDILIGELLLLARLESPESGLPRTPIDLGELLAEIVDDARLEIVGQPRALRFDDATEAMTVEGDRELLRRALENVIRNALQHTSTSADVTVTLAPDGADALIHVIDGGAGFSADALSRLFAPFARGESPRQQRCSAMAAVSRSAPAWREPALSSTFGCR